MGELLDGEKEKVERNDVANTLDYADTAIKNKVRSFRSIAAAVFSSGLLLGIIVCCICDLAVNGGFTWSLFPVSAAVFSWAVCFPVIKLGVKGVALSLGAVTVLTLPFLAVLGILAGSDIMAVGVPVSIIGIAYLWSVFAVFRVIKGRRWLSAAVALLLMIPVCLLINLVASQMFAQPFIDIWDWLSFAIIAAGAAVFFVIDTKKKGKCHDKDFAGRG